MRHLSHINELDVIDMYVSGKTATQVAQRFGSSKAYVYKVLRRHGVDAHPRKNVAIGNDAVAAYVSGLSENAVADMFGVSRACIRAALKKAGVHIRNQSEAEALKWSQMTSEQRAHQVAKAHIAAANRTPESIQNVMLKNAITSARTGAKIGFLEQEFTDAIRARGFDVVQQFPFDRYNLDLASGRTAIEVHANTANPHSYPMYRKRIVYLLKAGWNVIYIKCIGKIDINAATDEVCRFIDLTQRDESFVGQYRMVRGSGELVTSLRLDGDQLAPV